MPKQELFREGPKEHFVFGEPYTRISSVGRTLEDFGIREGIEYAFAAWTAEVACDVVEAAVNGEPFKRRTVDERFDGWVYDEIDVTRWPRESLKKYLSRHPRNMLDAAADRGLIVGMLVKYAQDHGWPHPGNVRHLVEEWTSAGRWLCDIDETTMCMASLANWGRAHDFEPLLVELPLWCHRLKVAGRADVYGVYQGDLWLLDVKTRAEVAPPRIEQVVQLAGYGSCTGAMGSEGEVPAPQFARAGALVCAPDGANLYEIQELEKWKRMFKKCLDIKRATASVAGMTKGHGKVPLELADLMEVTA